MLFQCKACGPATDHGSAPKRSGKAKRWRTIDIHCHCMVPEANAMVLKATGIPGGGETPNANAHVNALTKSIQPQRGKIDFPKLTDLDTRLADMDRDGIDVQVISPYPGHFVYAAPPEVARDSCHMVNDHIAGMVAKHPDRLMGMGTVPLQDPGMAVTELNRTVKELGFRGVELCTNVRGVDLTRAGLEKFFARVEELGVMIFLHPFGTSLVGRMEDHYFPNTVGHPLDSALCVGHLVFDGYLERFPELKICIAHGGGYIPGYWGRFDHAFAHREDCRVTIKKKPSEYLKKLYFDTVVFDERELKTSDRDLGRRSHHARHRLSVRHGGTGSGRLARPDQGRQQEGHGAGGGWQCRAAVGLAGRRMIDGLATISAAVRFMSPTIYGYETWLLPNRSRNTWTSSRRTRRRSEKSTIWKEPTRSS